MLCDTGSGDVQKSPIWGLGSVAGDADEVESNTVSITLTPAHSDICFPIKRFRDIMAGDVNNMGS